MTTPADAGRDAFRRDGERIEVLLAELRGSVGPLAMPRVEELVQRLTSLYGEGLSRLLDLAIRAGASAAVLSASATADDLLGSLLLLHGLHPTPLPARVELAVGELDELLAPQGARCALVGHDRTVARVHLEAAGWQGGAAALERAVRSYLESAVPDLPRLELSGLPAAGPVGLVQLRASGATP